MTEREPLQQVVMRTVAVRSRDFRNVSRGVPGLVPQFPVLAFARTGFLHWCTGG